MINARFRWKVQTITILRTSTRDNTQFLHDFFLSFCLSGPLLTIDDRVPQAKRMVTSPTNYHRLCPISNKKRPIASFKLIVCGKKKGNGWSN